MTKPRVPGNCLSLVDRPGASSWFETPRNERISSP
jgi:hypothetical protein